MSPATLLQSSRPSTPSHSALGQSGLQHSNAAALLLQRSSKANTKRMTLDQLFKKLPVQVTGSMDRNVEALTTDSRRTVPGAVFFAMPGQRTDGALFIEEAANRGALAVVSEKPCWVPPRLTLIVVDDVRAALAEVARRFYGYPHKNIDLIGISGTSGKTVVASLLRSFLLRKDSCGLLGTNHYALGKRTLPSYRTTPEPIELYGMLAQMRDADCRKAILEVSSHGIHQGRVEGLAFDAAVFTNLTPEHLDYHGDMEGYYSVVSSFLKSVIDGGSKKLVLSADDPYSRRFIEEHCKPEGWLTFGMDASADFRAEEIELSAQDSRFQLVWPEGRLKVVSPLIGVFNVQNVLAAMATAWQYGMDPVELAGALIDFEGVRGRMERVDCGQPFEIVVDYAHTQASYEKALKALRELTPGKLITVFGCGGNRDRASRPLITRTVIDGSDQVIATADNPRNETVDTIFEDMRSGVKTGDAIIYINDRRQAISQAIQMARAGDTILIAGKGHETFQEFADSLTPFDDRAIARDIIRNRELKEL